MIKFNKIASALLIIGAASVVSGVANAAMYEAPPGMEPEATSSNNGVYVGIGVGGIGFENQVTGSGTTTITGIDTSETSNTVDSGNYGLNGDLFAGYAWTFSNKVFIAGEIFGTLTNVPVASIGNSTKETDGLGGTATDTTDVNMTLKGTYGVRALPGYQVTPSTVVYGIVGYSRAKTDTETSHDLTATPNGGSTSTFENSSSDTFWFNGLQLGLGSMIKVTDHVALRGDMIWTGYQSQTIQSASSSNSTGSASGSIDAKPTTLEADVSLVYMFD